MTWPDAFVFASGVAGFVALAHVVMPYVRSRTDEQRREAALKAANERLDRVESALAERRMPTQLGRRTA